MKRQLLAKTDRQTTTNNERLLLLVIFLRGRENVCWLVVLLGGFSC